MNFVSPPPGTLDGFRRYITAVRREHAEGIAFAFAIAALVTKRTGDIWFRTTRRWTIFAWFSLGTGILLDHTGWLG